MDIYLISSFFFITFIFAFCALLYFKEKILRKYQSYTSWLESSLYDIFLPKVAVSIRKILLGIAVFCLLFGLLLPSGFSSLDTFTLNRAVKMNANGEYLDALTILERFRRSSSPLAYNEIGVSYLGMGDFKLSVTAFEKALKLYPIYPQAHLNLSSAYSFLGKEVDAALELRQAKAVSKYPVNVDAIYGLNDDGPNWFLRVLTIIFLISIGIIIPGLVTLFLKKRRIKQFDNLLPEGLLMATNGLRAGLSLGQVFEVIADEAPKPLNQEFSLIVKEQKLGKTLEDALINMSKRMPTDDTIIFVNAIRTLREVGGNLPEVFENLADTIRERKMLKEKISTMLAEGKTQAIMLILLPIIMGWILSKLSPKEFSLLYTTPLGIAILVFMCLWGALGAFFMWKTIQIKI